MRNYILPVLFGLFAGITIDILNPFFALFCFIPIFYWLKDFQTISKNLILFNIFKTVYLIQWTIPLSAKYTGGNYYFGLIAFFMLIFINLIIEVVPIIIASKLIKKQNYFYQASLIILVILLTENFKAYVFFGFPWINHFIGLTQLPNNYVSQFFSFGGFTIIGLIVLIINSLIAKSINSKKIAYSTYAFVIYALINLNGYIIKLNNKQSKPEGINTVAFSNVFIPPTDLFDSETGPSHIKRYFKIIEEVRDKADLLIWPESVVPWSISENDDFLRNIITKSNGLKHIMGLNIPIDSLYHTNSALFISDNLDMSKSVSKYELLKFLEIPAFSWQVPILSESVFKNIMANSESRTLDTEIGKISVLICNENLGIESRAKITNEEPDFCVNISNDAWFTSFSGLKKVHFYLNRMIAIQNRKFVFVNSNGGYSGLFSPDGSILLQVADSQKDYIFYRFEQ